MPALVGLLLATRPFPNDLTALPVDRQDDEPLDVAGSNATHEPAAEPVEEAHRGLARFPGGNRCEDEYLVVPHDGRGGPVPWDRHPPPHVAAGSF